LRRPFIKGKRRPFIEGGGCSLTYELDLSLMWWEGRTMNFPTQTFKIQHNVGVSTDLNTLQLMTFIEVVHMHGHTQL